MVEEEANVFKDKVQAAKFFVLFSVMGVAMELVTGAVIAAFSGKALWYYPEPSFFFSSPFAAPLWGFYAFAFVGVYYYFK